MIRRIFSMRWNVIIPGPSWFIGWVRINIGHGGDSNNSSRRNSGDQGGFLSVLGEESVTFYADGTADERQIELADRDGFRLALRINPVTSRVKVTAMGHK